MEKTRKYKEGEIDDDDEYLVYCFHFFSIELKTNFIPEEYYPDSRFHHNQQIHERLNFLK